MGEVWQASQAPWEDQVSLPGERERGVKKELKKSQSQNGNGKRKCEAKGAITGEEEEGRSAGLKNLGVGDDEGDEEDEEGDPVAGWAPCTGSWRNGLDMVGY